MTDSQLERGRAEPEPAERKAPMRIGIVGAGAVAARHIATLRSFPDVVVVSVADPDTGRAAALADAAGAVARSSVHDLLDADSPDAVYLCLPPFAHGEPERAVIAAGVPFFVEKPLGLAVEPAASIAAEVQQAGLLTATGYHWRYLDGVQHAAELLADRPPRLAVGTWLDKVPPPAWWPRRSGSGGQLVEQATHVLDLLRVLVGEVTSVHAVGARLPRPETDGLPDGLADGDGIDDVSAATLRFASGAVGSVATTSLLGWKHQAGITLYADRLVIELTETALTVHDDAGPRSLPVGEDAKVAVDRDFVDAARGGPDRIRAPYAEALRTHRLACAMAQSAAEGRAVQVDDF